jgi:hypothetical protein
MTTWEEWFKSVNERLAAIELKLEWHEKRIDTVFEQINKLRDELVETFFVEKMQRLIVDELKHQDKTQQEIAQKLPDFTTHPMHYHAFYRAWTLFEKHKVIVPISRGRGHPRLWHLTIREVADC